jgi:hypothetical protein
MEGSVIQGLALCEGAVVKMAAKVYGATQGTLIPELEAR